MIKEKENIDYHEKIKTKIGWKNSKYKANRAMIYLLPMTDLSIDDVAPFILNCYFRCDLDRHQGDYKKRIYVAVLNRDINPLLMSFINKSHYHVNSFSTEYITVFSFSIPGEYLNDYNLLEKGHYSKTSEIYKMKIIKTYCSEDSNIVQNKIYNTIYPTEKIRKSISTSLNVPLSIVQEVTDAPCFSRETFSEDLIFDLVI